MIRFILTLVVGLALPAAAIAAPPLVEGERDVTALEGKDAFLLLLRDVRAKCRDVERVTRKGEHNRDITLHWIYCVDGEIYQVLRIPSMRDMFIQDMVEGEFYRELKY